MTIENQIRDEKLQYDINREAAKIPASLSGKIDKYEYLTGEEAKLFILLWEKVLKNKQKQLKIKEKNKTKAIQDKKSNKSIKELEYDSDDDPMLLKQKIYIYI